MVASLQDMDVAIVGWATSGLLADPASRVTADWPLARFHEALGVAMMYLVTIFVFAAMMRMKHGKEEAVTPKGLTVAEKFAREPVLILQAIYNPIQVALCAWMVYEALYQHQLRGMSLVCNVFDPTQTGMARVLWVFYLSKVLDFMDTFFMVARCKWRQLSFLHLYHHTSIFMVYWLNLNAGYDGDIYFTIVLNGGIHFVMYGYYALQTFNISVPLAIKALITRSQMIQFVCMNTQAVAMLYGNCAFPRNITWLYMFYIFSMLFLFNDFSRKTYKKGSNKASTDAKASAGKAIDEVRSDASEVLIDGILYDVQGMKHPGGSIIRFLTGVGDASHAFAEFHERSKRADRCLKALPKRPCPPEILARRQSSEKDQELTRDFTALRAKLKLDGFFDPAPLQIVWRLFEVVAMHGAGAWLLLVGLGMGPLGMASDAGAGARFVASFLGVLMLGLASGRCGWLMHEGGHYSLTGKIGVDRMLQATVYGMGCAMSGRWWRTQHNKHHATPQKHQHDSDLDTLPLVSFNARISDSVRSPLLKSWLRLQGMLFVPLTSVLVAFGWQTFLHPRHIYRGLLTPSSRKEAFVEAISIMFRYYMIFCVLCGGLQWSSAFGIYMAINALSACYIFTNFALSHTHLPTSNSDECLHWVEYASAHTTNLEPGFLCNWWMCYLNYQIEHHLFPSMPQFRHPGVAPHVQALFAKHGLRYDVRPYWTCMGQTLRNLHDVGQSAGGKSKSA